MGASLSVEQVIIMDGSVHVTEAITILVEGFGKDRPHSTLRFLLTSSLMKLISSSVNRYNNDMEEHLFQYMLCCNHMSHVVFDGSLHICVEVQDSHQCLGSIVYAQVENF